MVQPDVRYVLQEQHHQDVILVFGRVHGAAERVTGFPEDAVDFVLKDVFLQDFVLGDLRRIGYSHSGFPLCVKYTRKPSLGNMEFVAVCAPSVDLIGLR